MIIAAAVCPDPPLLLRELNGTHDSVEPLRESCLRAIDELVSSTPDTIIAIGADDGRPHGGLPLSLRIADRLLTDRWRGPTEWHMVAPDALGHTCHTTGEALGCRTDRIGLLVMANGSACRDIKAPGYLDERAHHFDARIVHAIECGDWRVLRDVDTHLAEQLLVQGHAPLRVLGSAMQRANSDRMRCQVHYLDDPFGVLYLVATWTVAPTYVGDGPAARTC
jgi:hypothetical protein